MLIDDHPNAKYINRIIQSYDSHQQVWADAWYSVWQKKDFSYNTMSVEFNNFSCDKKFKNEVRALNVSGIPRAAILCLIVHEECAYMLDSDPDDLIMLARLGDNRAALMYWAGRTMKEIDEQ